MSEEFWRDIGRPPDDKWYPVKLTADPGTLLADLEEVIREVRDHRVRVLEEELDFPVDADLWEAVDKIAARYGV